MLLTKELLHTTDAHIKKLKAGGLETTEDLLLYFPRNLEDRSEVLESFTLVQLKEKNTLRLTIESIVSERTRSGKTLTKVILKDIHGYFSEAVYFTKPYFLSKYASGDVVLLHGKAKYDYGKLSFPAPEIELASSVETTLVPIYSDCQYIPGSWFEGKISYVRPYLSEISEVLPAEIRRTKGFRARALNIESLHFPRSPDDFERARRELAYEELYAIQYRGLAKKYDARDLTNGKSPVIPLRSDLIKELLTRLPYELTGKQKIVLFQILRDMEAPFAMTRLLQGDVGTGKTVVAFLAIIHAIREAGIQCVCMAPTEILARQHFEGFLRDF